MFNRFSNNMNRTRLRTLMWGFFIAMAVPTSVLVYKSYDQLKWEAFYQHRLLAEEFTARIDRQFDEFIAQEESRKFTDYSFIVQASGPANNFIERSPLSNYPIETDYQGVIGYFQIDDQGRFSTPFVPDSLSLAGQYGISQLQLQERLKAQTVIENVLSSNQLVSKRDPDQALTDLASGRRKQDAGTSELASPSLAPSSIRAQSDFEQRGESDYSVSNEILAKGGVIEAKEIESQLAFDNLSQKKSATLENARAKIKKESVLGRLQELELNSPYKEQVDKRKNADLKKSNKRQIKEAPKLSRKSRIEEQASVLEDRDIAFKDERGREDKSSGDGIGIFENEIDNFEISLLESGHFVLYRKVWRNGKRFIQGLLIQNDSFLSSLFQKSFRDTLLSDMSNLTLIYQGNALAAYSESSYLFSRRDATQLDGTLLYRTSMAAPFSELESVFTIRYLPAGPGGNVILWAGFILALVLSAGVYLLYRMSLRNITLVNQQQDFVSAISHELKTPLTSIRMYGEILQQGWADEEKKKTYYSFIYDESKRLTRLINNVLELARMTRNETRVNLQKITVSELTDIIHSKVDSQIERAGFTLELTTDDNVQTDKIKIDPDIFAQIIINLVDNALKFSVKADKQTIDISANKQSDGDVLFVVRDYGPGVAKDQLKKIFELFYRSENELTRQTTGTGIGLALVSQLTQLMNGKIDVINREPGAEFRLYFPSQSKSQA